MSSPYKVVLGQDRGIELRGDNRELVSCRAQEVIIAGPAETGKSYVACLKLHLTCMKYAGSQHAMVRKTNVSIAGTVGKTFQRVIAGAGVHSYGGETPSKYIYPNGSCVWVGGMDNPDAILSAERDTIYVCQAEELSLKDWETLGQMLTQGQLTGNYGTPHSVGGNQIKDQISGLNTLFGSKPIIYDGKLLGYSQEASPDPIIDTWNTQSTWSDGGNWFKKPKQYTSWDVGGAALGREYTNPSWWQANATPTMDGNALIKAENAANNPGWTNSDYFSRNSGLTSSGGGFGLGAFVNTLTQAADPLSWELWLLCHYFLFLKAA